MSNSSASNKKCRLISITDGNKDIYTYVLQQIAIFKMIPKTIKKNYSIKVWDDIIS